MEKNNRDLWIHSDVTKMTDYIQQLRETNLQIPDP